jgi:uncharacterized protein (TIGR00661 family)
MKILYAIQGTGNGHLARATAIVPLLKEMGETDVLVSGISGDINLPFPVRYQLYGMSFIFGTKGGVDLEKTILKLRLFRFLKDVARLPVKKYDIVLCDFEPVSAWACKLKRKKSIGLGHQYAVLHPDSPSPPKSDWFGKLILKHYAPVSKKYGFHFKQLDAFNFEPVIRPDIRNCKPENKGHFTVYLPSFSDEKIIRILSLWPEIKWEVFSKHSKSTYRISNILIQPISLEKFNLSFTSCEGILCTAGFETPAETIFMGKKLCVVPIKNQFEQACNAAFLSEMGITVIDDLLNDRLKIKHWLENSGGVQIKYQDKTGEILQKIIMHENVSGVLFKP